MEQYINKSALVSEIESKIEKYTKRGEESDAKRDGYGMYWGGVLSCLNEVMTLCDTIEVKEVDLDKEIEEQCKKVNQLAVGKELRNICRYFFELGLKAQKGGMKYDRSNQRKDIAPRTEKEMV